MKRLSLLAPILSMLISLSAAHAQVDQILQSIEQEQSSPSKVQTTQSAGEAPPKVAHEKPPHKPKEVRTKKADMVQIWGPKDRLPEQIAGQLLAGDFEVLGQSINGHALLIGENGLFGRTFEVDNLTTGLAPGQCYPTGQNPRYHVDSKHPLIFIERGILGCYTVRASQ